MLRLFRWGYFVITIIAVSETSRYGVTWGFSALAAAWAYLMVLSGFQDGPPA